MSLEPRKLEKQIATWLTDDERKLLSVALEQTPDENRDAAIIHMIVSDLRRREMRGLLDIGRH